MMPRIKGKARKIAYNILGAPPNRHRANSGRKKARDKKLYELEMRNVHKRL